VTTQSREGKETEFSLWLRNKLPDNVTFAREDDALSSKLGFITTDIDYIWMNFKTNEWIIIEEKRRRKEVPFAQKNILVMIHNLARKHDKKYRGLYLIQFERTNPEDGKIWINNKEVTKENLIKLLRFEWIWRNEQ
jgi:hypothetical protein